MILVEKLLGSLALALFLLAAVYTPAEAALMEGSFMPYAVKQTAMADSGNKYYQIKKGDTLWGIARTYNTDLALLMSINGLQKDSILKIGQTIELPGNDSRVHIIKKGETYWSIASLYDIKVQDLQTLNSEKNPRNLKIGDQLVIPGSAERAIAVMARPSRGLTGGIYSWPLTGTITSTYGWRKSGFHHGLDIAANIGAPVKAACSGQVIFVGARDIYGKTVIISHADGRQTLYAHLNNYEVKNGQQVAKGQVIASVGITGRTTGPHLHFGVMQGEETFDPLIFLRN